MLINSIHMALLASILLPTITFIVVNSYLSVPDSAYMESKDKFTIRVNTFRRLDLIRYFTEYYETCDVIQEIQVVWSDTENSPPDDLVKLQNKGKVKLEVHSKNSLTNRFKPLIEIPTDAVLSIDDDLIIPCEDLEYSLNIWKSNPNVLVGYTPRMHGFDPETGATRYRRWQNTWWNGMYSIVLTKAAFFHKKYLADYQRMIPKEVDDFIDKERNCEDIAMAHIIADQSKSPPVWMRGNVYEISTSGISSGTSHFNDRGVCLEVIRDHLGTWPWLTGYQKVLPLSITDFWSLWH